MSSKVKSILKNPSTFDDPANRACNLECLEDNQEIAGFTGLVKIVLVQTSHKEYCIKVWWAGFIGLAYILMGATSTIVFFFTLSMTLPFAENVHIMLCTLGFQLLIPSGILMLSSINGPSVPLTVIHRKLSHVFTQSCGLGCGLGGATLIILFGKESFINFFTFHCISGVLTCIVVALGTLFGPFLLCIKPDKCCSGVVRPIHKGAGVTSFLLSSICLITGLMKKSFTKWLPLSDMLYWLIAFCFIYSIIITTVPFVACLATKREQK